jgi:hypothetical protein
MRKVFLTASFAVVAFLCAGIATAVGPSAVVRSGNLEVTFGEGFAPKALSRTVPTPIALRLWSRINSIGGSPPAALSEFVFDTDENSAIDVRGLATCSFLQYRSRSANPGLDCGNAIVGKGTVTLDLHFPEEAPIPVKGKLTIYNGGAKAGVTTLNAVGDITLSSTTTITTRMKIRIERIREGRFASRAIVTVPKIANGYGSLTSFNARLERSFVRKGRRVSLLTAKCPGGRIYARAEANFVDGTRIRSPLVRDCVPSD